MKCKESFFEELKLKAKNLKRELGALYIAYRRPDTPFRAKLVAAIIVGYALSPIDLIPDFIPVIGYLDDLIILPLGIKLAIKLIPGDIMNECRWEAEKVFNKGKLKNKNYLAGGLIIVFWILIFLLIIMKIYK